MVDNYIIEMFLQEAKNPDNEEINGAIRRYLDSDKNYIPKKDRELFDKHGYTPDKFSRKYGSKKYISNNETDKDIFADVDYHPDYDYANYLDKKKLDKNDREVPSNDIRHMTRGADRHEAKDPKDTSKMSLNQFTSLQPYWDEKYYIKRNNANKKAIKRDEEEQIKNIKDSTQRQIRSIDDENARYVNDAKEAHAARTYKRKLDKKMKSAQEYNKRKKTNESYLREELAIDKMKKEIESTKRKLIQKARSKGGVWENFGQNEYWKIANKYSDLQLDYYSEYSSLLNRFSDWCMNYTGMNESYRRRRIKESLDEVWIIIPVEHRYDDNLDIMKFANKYGVFETRNECFDKIIELAPDRWDAFIPMCIHS